MSFSQQILEFQKKVERRHEAVRRRAAGLLAAEVVRNTPVKSGALRGNWQWGWNAPPMGITGKLDKSGNGALSEIESRLAFGPRKGGVTGYLTNNLPYATRIEYGWSQQAPSGMVRLAVAKWPSFIAQAAAEAQVEIP